MTFILKYTCLLRTCQGISHGQRYGSSMYSLYTKYTDALEVTLICPIDTTDVQLPLAILQSAMKKGLSECTIKW